MVDIFVFIHAIKLAHTAFLSTVIATAVTIRFIGVMPDFFLLNGSQRRLSLLTHILLQFLARIDAAELGWRSCGGTCATIAVIIVLFAVIMLSFIQHASQWQRVVQYTLIIYDFHVIIVHRIAIVSLGSKPAQD
jgi:hypothetical protein